MLSSTISIYSLAMHLYASSLLCTNNKNTSTRTMVYHSCFLVTCADFWSHLHISAQILHLLCHEVFWVNPFEEGMVLKLPVSEHIVTKEWTIWKPSLYVRLGSNVRLDVAHLYLLVLTIPHWKDGWVSVPPGIFTPSCKLVLIYSYSWFLLFAHKMLTCHPDISWSCLNPLNYQSVLTQRYAFKHLMETPFKFSNHALLKNWTSQPAITPRNTSRLNILIFPPTW